jgi:hypothetical protein
MYDAYRCCTLPKVRMCENIEHKKHEYREEMYAELRGKSAREEGRAVEML